MRRVQRTKRRYRAGLPWTVDEEACLARLYSTHSNQELATLLGRSEWAISGKARGMGLTRDHEGTYCRHHPGGHPWSSHEIAVLTELYPIMPYEELAERIGRSHDAVKMKARKLKLRKIDFWNDEDDRLLRELYPRRDCKQVAERLGRTLLAVKARVMTLKLDSKVPNWQANDIRLLRSSYGTVPLSVIARELGRTRAATAKKAREIGLVQFRHWSRADVQVLKGLYAHCEMEQLTIRLGHSCKAIRYKARQLGLVKPLRSERATAMSSRFGDRR